MKLRWLVVRNSRNNGNHPSAIDDIHPHYMKVLQYFDEELKKWRDIPMVSVDEKDA